jgi:hypothetical protein
MRNHLGFDVLMLALIQTIENDWTIVFSKDKITMTHSNFGEFLFSNLDEVGDFLHEFIL